MLQIYWVTRNAALCLLIVFGPPNVTLNCSSDYINLKKQIEVSWEPILLKNETTESLSTEEVRSRIQNCDTIISCSGGYKITVSVAIQFHKQPAITIPFPF